MEKRRWTVEEVGFLERESASSTLKELSVALDRPVRMVRWKLGQLGLTFKDGRAESTGAPRTVWSEENLRYLAEHAQDWPASQIAEALQVDERSVRDAMHRYQIAGRGQSRTQAAEEVEKRAAAMRGRLVVDREEPRECTRCHEVKPVFSYPSETTMQSGMCEDCRKEVRRTRWHDQTDEEKQQQTALQRLRNHGLTPETYAAMLTKQNNTCGVCHEPMLTTPDIDHDHTHCPGVTGCAVCVRGLLHHRCNLAVGWAEQFDANPEFLQQIAVYLQA